MLLSQMERTAAIPAVPTTTETVHITKKRVFFLRHNLHRKQQWILSSNKLRSSKIPSKVDCSSLDGTPLTPSKSRLSSSCLKWGWADAVNSTSLNLPEAIQSNSCNGFPTRPTHGFHFLSACEQTSLTYQKNTELPLSISSMASVELEETRSGGGGGGGEREGIIKVREKSSKKVPWKLGFACLRTEYDSKGNFDMEVVGAAGERRNPIHLVVMVNGLSGNAQQWGYAAKQFLKKYPEDVIAHCSECNSSALTYDGVDVMGERLAKEVIAVIKRHPGVQKISFVGHSLGGLVARYAIAKLYERDISQGDGELRSDGSKDLCTEEKFKGKVAGLEPMNFITSATPHLGSRGHKQVPFLCGFSALEKVASRLSWFLGRTGKHLFLTDNDDGKPPLLLRMVNDGDDLKFISALQSFKHCVAYANARFDHMVGWSTSSLRRQHELPKLQNLSKNEEYPHIVNVETAQTSSTQQEDSLETKVNEPKNLNLEEEMIRGLTRVSWERVDVDLAGSKQRFLAHNTIQVQQYSTCSEGADVIQHMIDNFLLQ